MLAANCDWVGVCNCTHIFCQPNYFGYLVCLSHYINLRMSKCYVNFLDSTSRPLISKMQCIHYYQLVFFIGDCRSVLPGYHPEDVRVRLEWSGSVGCSALLTDTCLCLICLTCSL